MNTPPTLRVDRLGLRNFRCFAECTIALHPHLTVLVAENGVAVIHLPVRLLPRLTTH